MKTRIAIFDLDGTLVDSRCDLTTAVNLMRRDYGLAELDIETVVSYIGDGAETLAERSLQGFQTDIEVALGRMEGYYLEHIVDKTYVYNGVPEGLELLHNSGYLLAVITNKPEGMSKTILHHFKLDTYFTHIIGSDSGFPLKPSPESILYVLHKNDSETKSSWMLGDNYTDLEAGRRANIKRCFCAYGFGKPGKFAPDRIATSFSNVVDVILAEAD